MIVETHNLRLNDLTPGDTLQTYCGLDCCVTFEVLEELHRLFNEPPITYGFKLALQAPALEMMLRGFAIDAMARQSAIVSLREERDGLQDMLNEFAIAFWGRPLNARSYPQLKEFFYGAMRIPEVTLSFKGQRRVSVNREALEKIEVYYHARLFVSIILAIRDVAKRIEVLATEVDSDGRMRTSYNIAGTESERWSSSSNAFGTGTNLQNITPELRRVFVADDGWKLCGIDLEQAESREVGWLFGTLFGDWRYLDACEAGDLHTSTAKLIWPDLVRSREDANKPFYRGFSHRDMAKRGGHLCLTEDHEVLTPFGWTPIASKPSRIMTWTPQDKSQFQDVRQWTDEPYSGTMHEFDGNSVSINATDNHRIPFKKDQRYDFYVGRAKDGPQTHMPLGNGWIGGSETVPARLIAAFMSDGHQNSANRMVFHLKKDRKISRLEELCTRYGYEFERRGDKTWVIGSLPKVAGAFMFDWTIECLLDFLDEYKHWDGHVSATAVTLSSSDCTHLEWIQTFGRICGIGGALSKVPVSLKKGWRQPYRLQQNNRIWAAGASISWVKRTVNNCRVLCPTVTNEFFYVRRNGKISVTGNTNYMGTAWTASRSLKVPLNVMEAFQASYIAAYPSFPRWWRHCAQCLETEQSITTPFGNTRHFFGRPKDDTTLREAIAHSPQSSTALRLNLALWRIWNTMGTRVQILAQVHDALYFQYRESDNEAEIIAQALALISTPLTHKSRTFDVPGESKTGWNWGAFGPDNPDGLKKYKGKDQRQRTTGLARVM
jgi:DNA polymerase I-like protein with 3'-5' exonuclease and polymerase domains